MTQTAAHLRHAPLRSHCKPTGWTHRWTMVIASGLLLVGACESPEAAHGFGVAAAQFQDVVVPSGFKLRDAGHESYSREEAGWRQAHLVYHGNAKIEEAMGYVRQRMPQHSWTALPDEAANESGVRLRFERGVYSANYTFVQREGSTQMVVDYTTDYARR